MSLLNFRGSQFKYQRRTKIDDLTITIFEKKALPEQKRLKNKVYFVVGSALLNCHSKIRK